MSGIMLVLQVGGQVRGTLPLDEGDSFAEVCLKVKECLKLPSDVAALEVMVAQGVSKLVTTDEGLSQVMGMIQENFVVVQVVCGAVAAGQDKDDAFVFVKMKRALEGDDCPQADLADSESDDLLDSDSDSEEEEEEEEEEDVDDDDDGSQGNGVESKAQVVAQGVEQFKASFPSEQDCLSFLVFAQVKRGKAKKFGLVLTKTVPQMTPHAALEREDVILANFVQAQVPLGLVLKKLGFKPKKLKKAGLVRLAHVFFQWRRGHKKCKKRDHRRHYLDDGVPNRPLHHHGHHHGPPHHHHGPPHHHHGHHHHHHGPPHRHHGHHHHHHGPSAWGSPWNAQGHSSSSSSSSSSSDSSDEDTAKNIPFAEYANNMGHFRGPPPFAMRGGRPWLHGPGAGPRGRGGMRRHMKMRLRHGHGPRGRRGFRNGIGSNKRLARLVRHKNIADGTTLKTQSTFSKTWVVRNDSEKQWPASAQLICIGGDDMETNETMSQLVGPLKPGQECEVSITSLQVPPLAGLYKSFYRFETTDGQRFGQRLWCSVMAEQ